MSRLNEFYNQLSPWVYLIALVNILLHLAFYNTLGFHRDELLYFSLGQHPSAGYASVPPFTGFIAWLCTGPHSSFNEFWKQRVPQITNPFHY
jgi:hypothetical protein